MCFAILCKWCVVVTMVRSSANSASSMCQLVAHAGCVTSPFDMSRASAALEVKRPVASNAVTRRSRGETPVLKDLVGGECLLGATAKNRLAEFGRIIVHPAGMFTLSDQNFSHSSEHAQFIKEECVFHTGRRLGSLDKSTPTSVPRPVRFPTLMEILTGQKT